MSRVIIVRMGWDGQDVLALHRYFTEGALGSPSETVWTAFDVDTWIEYSPGAENCCHDDAV